MEKRKALAKYGPWVLGGLVLLGIYVLRDVLTPFLMAALVAYILDPLVTKLERRGRLSRGMVVGLLVLLLIVCVSVVAPFVIYKIVSEARAFVENVPEIVEDWTQQITQEKATHMPEWLRLRLFEAMERGKAYVDDLSRGVSSAEQGQTVKDVVTTVLGGVAKGIGGITSLVFDALIFIVVTAYILKDFQKMVSFFKALIPQHVAPVVLQALGEINLHLRNFFRGAVTVAFFLTLFYMIGLLIIGVPYSYLLGVLAGAANVIPAAGPLIATVVALIVTWVHSHAWGKLIAVAALLALGQVLDNTLLTPKVVGDKVGLNPAVIILSIMVCGKFLGFFGVLLAVPIAATAKVILGIVIERYKASPVFTGES